VGFMEGRMGVDCRYAIVCLALPLSACHVLADRDWNPRVRPGECVVREVRRHEGVLIKNYDAHGRLISGTKKEAHSIRWENFQYDASGRLIAITSQEDQPAYDALCDLAGGCTVPSQRAIDRVDLEWDSHGRLRRDRRKRDEYINEYISGGEYIRDHVTDDVTEYDYDDTGRLLTVSENGSQRKIGSHDLLDPRDFHYDDQGRLLRHVLTNDSEHLRYETWDYGSDGAVTQKLDVSVYHANKVRPLIREEAETLYVYEDAGRLREIRFRGEPHWTYTYTGKCDEVRNTPRVPSPMDMYRCLVSPHFILEICW